MEKQMELFEDGGLKDEGGMVDEQSGNDVPVGSSRKEVRDDIPAMLSEGEFVFPADVVRYHGLDKLMDLRQEAKMGLKQMEAMGQMGNSEEATMPDDMPFGPSDLILIGGEMEDGPREMAEGGVVYANQGTFATGIGGYQPSIYQGQQTSSTYAPPPSSVAPPAPTASPAGGYMPKFVTNQTTPFNDAGTAQTATNTTTGVDTASTEDKFVPTVEDKYTTLTYINKETNEKRDFYFYNGNPVTPIPDGFVPYDATVDETVSDLESTSVETTQVTSGSDDPPPMETPEPVDYGALSTADLKKAYSQNQTATAIMAGLTAVNPIFGLFGSWATRSTGNTIAKEMKKRGIKVPESTGIKGVFGKIIDGVKDMLGLDDEQTTVVTNSLTESIRPKLRTTDSGSTYSPGPVDTSTAAAQAAELFGGSSDGGGEFGMSSTNVGSIDTSTAAQQAADLYGGNVTTGEFGNTTSNIQVNPNVSNRDNSPPKTPIVSSSNTGSYDEVPSSNSSTSSSSNTGSYDEVPSSSTSSYGSGSNASSGGLEGLGYIYKGGLMDKDKLVTKPKPKKNRGIAARKKKK